MAVKGAQLYRAMVRRQSKAFIRFLLLEAAFPRLSGDGLENCTSQRGTKFTAVAMAHLTPTPHLKGERELS